MRASFAFAASRSHAPHGREVEYITQSERSERAKPSLRIAHRFAFGVASPFAMLAHTAGPPADDFAVSDDNSAIRLIAGAHGLFLHLEGCGNERPMISGMGAACPYECAGQCSHCRSSRVHVRPARRI